MAGKQQHPYHLVNPSPWPIIASFSLMILAFGAAMAMHEHAAGLPLLVLGFGGVFFTMYVWWRDVIREGIHDKAHTTRVQHGLRMGMALFILSEVMFFFAFFFSFFSASIFPAEILDGYWPIKAGVWPPEHIIPFDPWTLPFLNTVILLLSGTTVTWAHYALLNGDHEGLKKGLLYTVILGVSFSLLQAYEYSHAAFGFKDGVYASNFYMATGFHGLHVMIGTLFLFVCYLRAGRGELTKENHLGFEFAAWYWHFVDVVWLFLFICVYWQGS